MKHIVLEPRIGVKGYAEFGQALTEIVNLLGSPDEVDKMPSWHLPTLLVYSRLGLGFRFDDEENLGSISIKCKPREVLLWGSSIENIIDDENDHAISLKRFLSERVLDLEYRSTSFGDYLHSESEGLTVFFRSIESDDNNMRVIYSHAHLTLPNIKTGPKAQRDEIANSDPPPVVPPSAPSE